MRDEEIQARWRQIAIEIGHDIRRTVNTPEMIGTDDETGYVLMFFNMRHHQGKATLVSSAESSDDVRQILEHTLRNMGKAQKIEPGREN